MRKMQANLLRSEPIPPRLGAQLQHYPSVRSTTCRYPDYVQDGVRETRLSIGQELQILHVGSFGNRIDETPVHKRRLKSPCCLLFCLIHLVGCMFQSCDTFEALSHTPYRVSRYSDMPRSMFAQIATRRQCVLRGTLSNPLPPSATMTMAKRQRLLRALCVAYGIMPRITE